MVHQHVQGCCGFPPLHSIGFAPECSSRFDARSRWSAPHPWASCFLCNPQFFLQSKIIGNGIYQAEEGSFQSQIRQSLCWKLPTQLHPQVTDLPRYPPCASSTSFLLELYTACQNWEESLPLAPQCDSLQPSIEAPKLPLLSAQHCILPRSDAEFAEPACNSALAPCTSAQRLLSWLL